MAMLVINRVYILGLPNLPNPLDPCGLSAVVLLCEAKVFCQSFALQVTLAGEQHPTLGGFEQQNTRIWVNYNISLT